LLKLMVPTEQVLSMVMHVSSVLHQAENGDESAKRLNRILTPLVKFRACRDNITVATGALEIRGGNGFIEDWVNARLVRDAHTGLLWEGTSNINALDITTRAIAQVGAHEDLAADLNDRLQATSGLPGQFAGELAGLVDRAKNFAEEIAASNNETKARQASDALYHVTTATLLATEGAALGQGGGDARRLLLSRLVIDTKLRARDPLENGDGRFEIEAGNYLLGNEKVPLDVATDLLRN